MSELLQARIRAGVVAVAPVAVLIGFLILPYIGDQTDNAKVADEIAANTTRLSWAVLILTGAMALTFLAVFSIRFYLRAAGEHTWSFIAVPLVVIGGMALVLGSGLQAGAAPVAEAGGDGEAYLQAADDWFVPLYLGGAIVFGLGWLSLAGSVVRSRVLSRELTWLVVVALVVLTIANFVPTGWAGYVIGVAAIVAAWPLAYAMWTHATPRPMTQAWPSPA